MLLATAAAGVGSGWRFRLGEPDLIYEPSSPEQALNASTADNIVTRDVAKPSAMDSDDAAAAAVSAAGSVDPRWEQERVVLRRLRSRQPCGDMRLWNELWRGDDLADPPSAPNDSTLLHTRFVWNDWRASRGETLPSAEHWDPACIMRTGTAFVPGDMLMSDWWPGLFVAGDGDMAHLPTHSKVEVMRFYRSDEYRDAADEATIDQVWYYHAPGSGIYLDLGRPLWAPPALSTLITPYSCQQTRGRYDTIIFRRNQTGLPAGRVRYGGLVEIVDCRGSQTSQQPATNNDDDEKASELVATTEAEARAGLAPHERSSPPWESACPPTAVSGWLSSEPDAEGQRAECACDPRYTYLNCYGNAGFSMSSFLSRDQEETLLRTELGSRVLDALTNSL